MASSNEKLPVPAPFLIFFRFIAHCPRIIAKRRKMCSLAFNVGATPRYTSGPTVSSLAQLLINQIRDED